MHELSIAQALVDQVQKIAKESNSGKVIRITLRIGKLAGVDPEALSFAFPIAAEGTCLHSTLIEVISVEPELRCRACGKSVETEFVLACVHCGSKDLDLKQGRELLIESVEMEDLS
jgi:hydrogenase nickel incorporation protein HypA/HybF